MSLIRFAQILKGIGPRLWLRGYTCTSCARFVLFFSGISAISTEYDACLMPYLLQGSPTIAGSTFYRCLCTILLSMDYSLAYVFCAPHDEGRLPLLIVLTCLFLPGTLSWTLINPLKTRSSTVSAGSHNGDRIHTSCCVFTIQSLLSALSDAIFSCCSM